MPEMCVCGGGGGGSGDGGLKWQHWRENLSKELATLGHLDEFLKAKIVQS